MSQWFNEDFAEKDAVRAAYPSFYLRQDKLGRPVYVERIGLLNLKELTKVTSIERLVTYHVFEYEALLKHHFPHLQSLKPEEERWDDKSVQSMTIVDLKVRMFLRMPSQKPRTLRVGLDAVCAAHSERPSPNASKAARKRCAERSAI